MKLRELLKGCRINVDDVEKSMGERDRQILDYELRPHMAGEQSDEVVHVEIVPEAKGIFLEYE
jgi:hypothetical protein